MYKYFVVQLVCFLFDVLLFSFLIMLGFDVFYANFISKSISGALSFFMLGFLVFPSRLNHSFITFLKYLTLWVSNIFLSSYLVVLLIPFVGMAVVSKVIIDILMFNLNFFISKYLVFRLRR